MTRDQMLETLTQMMRQAESLAAENDPVLRCEMPRIVAILHEARQLLDEKYNRLVPRNLADTTGT